MIGSRNFRISYFKFFMICSFGVLVLNTVSKIFFGNDETDRANCKHCLIVSHQLINFLSSDVNSLMSERLEKMIMDCHGDEVCRRRHSTIQSVIVKEFIPRFILAHRLGACSTDHHGEEDGL